MTRDHNQQLTERYARYVQLIEQEVNQVAVGRYFVTDIVVAQIASLMSGRLRTYREQGLIPHKGTVVAWISDVDPRHIEYKIDWEE